MRRREFIALLGGATAAWPRTSVAQAPGKRRLVAFLAGQTLAAGVRYSSVLKQRMKELGYVEGRDIEFAHFHAEGDMARLPVLAAEAAKLKPDVVVASNTQAVAAIQRVTDVIPIVGTVLADPIGLGQVASYARPGGNVTGILQLVNTLLGKPLALVTEMVPGSKKFGMLFNPDAPPQASQRKQVEEAAAALSLSLVPVEAKSPAGLDAAFDTLAGERVDGVAVIGDPVFFFERVRLATLAIGARLPTAFTLREHVEAGGLVSYGVDQRANFRRAADFIDKILKGADPGDLPVELPTTFELVVNLKTAKAIGVTVSEQFLVRADEVIE